MLAANSHQVTPIFFIIWVLLGIASSAFFYINKNATLKRKVLPFVLVGTGILFIYLALATGTAASGLAFLVPGVVIITLINLCTIKFCDSCGRTVINRNPFAPQKFCASCGEVLHK